MTLHEQYADAFRQLVPPGGRHGYYKDRKGNVRATSDLIAPGMIEYLNSTGYGAEFALPDAYTATGVQLPPARGPLAEELLANTAAVRVAQAEQNRMIAPPSSSSPTAASLGYDDDGNAVIPGPVEAKGPGAVFRPERDAQTRGEGAVSARSELLSRSADRGALRTEFNIPDIIGSIPDIINAFRPQLPAGRTPPMLPAPPGMGGTVAGRVGGSLRGMGKIFATLTAAGLTTEAIVALMSAGVIKVPKRKRGITAGELRGFSKVCSLVRKAGMVPKVKSTPKRKKC